MSSKKDLEIIYNLQWKNKPISNTGTRTSVLGMYDVPATTLNWNIFKSYLLKNSGLVGEDVKVSYITDSNKEFPIESQTDFQIALYAFRRKARMGDIVNLKIEPLNEVQTPIQKTKDLETHRDQARASVKKEKDLNDVETQSDNNEPHSIVSNCCNNDTPPEWFILFMNQFKKEVMEEVNSTVSGIVSKIKCHPTPQPAYHARKSKAESSKRMRKLQPLMAESSHDSKDLIKSLKMEGKLERKMEVKLERKLERLEHKTKKILAHFTRSSDSEPGQSSKPCAAPKEIEEDVLQMDAAPVNVQNVPHMLGGEIYMHQWEVKNTGNLPWTSKTTLNFTWGSKALKPLDSIISVPYLRPGDVGIIAVFLEVPNKPGRYECYWHFHHKERRFGQWLGCEIIVDKYHLGGKVEEADSTKFPRETNPDSSTHYKHDYQYRIVENKPSNASVKDEEEENASNHALDTMVRDINARIVDIKLQDPTDTNCSSDSDNQSIISLSESNCSKAIPEEFVVVPIPDCFKLDIPIKDEPNEIKQNNVEEIKPEESSENFDNNNNTGEIDQNKRDDEDDVSSNTSQKSDIVLITLPENGEDKNSDYALVIVDGQQLPIPKKMIKNEYLKAAEKFKPMINELEFINPKETSTVESIGNADTSTSASAIKSEAEVVKEQSLPENSDLHSHCSAAGSCFSDVNNGMDKSSRLFIFPQNNPGFEVVYPNVEPDDAAGPPQQNVPTWENPEHNYQFVNLIYPQLEQPQQPTFTQDNFTKPESCLFNTEFKDPFVNPIVSNYQQTPIEQRPPHFAVPADQAVTLQSTQLSSDAFGASSPPMPFPQPMQPTNIDTRTVTHPTAPVLPTHSPNTSSERRENIVHILPETLVSGAVNVASSAINTARTVINMIRPQENPGRWENGHWVSTSQDSSREANLQALAEMGFWDRDLNATLLARYNDDLSRVVAELVQ